MISIWSSCDINLELFGRIMPRGVLSMLCDIVSVVI